MLVDESTIDLNHAIEGCRRMGLDATVYCNCFELGNLRSAPLPEWSVYIDGTGVRYTRATDFDLVLAFDRWSEDACDHPEGIFSSHRLGHIGLIAFLREALSQLAHEFPIILSKVIYSGSHCGDFLMRMEVPALLVELEALSQLHADDPSDEPLLRRFEAQLKELVQASIAIEKPTSF